MQCQLSGRVKALGTVYRWFYQEHTLVVAIHFWGRSSSVLMTS